MAIELIFNAVGEFIGLIAGQIVGRTFQLEPKKAQAIGAYFALTLILGGAVIITFIYA